MTQVAQAAFRTIAPSDAIAEDHVVPYYLDDRKLRIAIARIGGVLYAFDDLCTCTDEHCPLSGGLLIETTVMCQCHGSRYEVTSGRPTTGPATEPLTTYPAREADGNVHIKV